MIKKYIDLKFNFLLKILVNWILPKNILKVIFADDFW